MPRLLHLHHQTSRYPVEQGAELDSQPILKDVVKVKISCTTRQLDIDSSVAHPAAQTQYRLGYPDYMRTNKPINKQRVKAGQSTDKYTARSLVSIWYASGYQTFSVHGAISV